jgi:hypothetical protein
LTTISAIRIRGVTGITIVGRQIVVDHRIPVAGLAIRMADLVTRTGGLVILVVGRVRVKVNTGRGVV